MDRKGLGKERVVVACQAEPRLPEREGQLVVDCGSAAIPDEDLTVIDVLVGQLLAFFRCLEEGLRPDAPSKDGVITRVVSDFTIHPRDGA